MNDWISSNDEICPDNYNYFRFKLKGKGRSEKWEVYLYGDKTIKVERDSAEVLTRGVLPPGIGGVGFGPSPNLATDHTIYELCLPSERGMGNEHKFGRPCLERKVQRDVRVHGSSCGTYRGVVHSPFERKYHRCHCHYGDHVLFVGRLH